LIRDDVRRRGCRSQAASIPGPVAAGVATDMSAAGSRSWAAVAGSMPCRLTAFAILYFLGAELGHVLAFHGVYGDFATYWPPSGLYLAAMLATTNWSTRLKLIPAAWAANLASDVWM